MLPMISRSRATNAAKLTSISFISKASVISSASSLGPRSTDATTSTPTFCHSKELSNVCGAMAKIGSTPSTESNPTNLILTSSTSIFANVKLRSSKVISYIPSLPINESRKRMFIPRSSSPVSGSFDCSLKKLCNSFMRILAQAPTLPSRSPQFTKFIASERLGVRSFWLESALVAPAGSITRPSAMTTSAVSSAITAAATMPSTDLRDSA
mmetsp:Transcript_11056/g.14519  ORF Transcript_11056/g.14519 Transcript_11056/m.14519 type:complete len:211 (-) Transcript_11056:1383-2015(-)